MAAVPILPTPPVEENRIDLIPPTNTDGGAPSRGGGGGVLERIGPEYGRTFVINDNDSRFDNIK